MSFWTEFLTGVIMLLPFVALALILVFCLPNQEFAPTTPTVTISPTVTTSPSPSPSVTVTSVWTGNWAKAVQMLPNLRPTSFRK